jgi:hypothetical protein
MRDKIEGRIVRAILMANSHEHEDAKGQILVEFRDWAKTNIVKTRADRLVFFNYLQREKPELLSFRCRGLDKWQQVNAWLSKPEVLR